MEAARAFRLNVAVREVIHHLVFLRDAAIQRGQLQELVLIQRGETERPMEPRSPPDPLTHSTSRLSPSADHAP